MAWEGDPPGCGGSPIPYPRFGGSMSTAICRIFTSEGFIVAADGRKFVTGPHSEIKNDTQKIFCLETPGGKLAYSLGGTVGLGPDDSDEIVFPFRRETEKAAREIKGQPANLHEYAQRLSASMHRELLAVQGRIDFDGGETEPTLPGSTIAWIFLDGYFNGQPSRASLRFFREDQVLPTPEVYRESDNVGDPLGYGSEKIFREVFKTDNPQFAQYRKPKLLSDQVTLEYAREMAEGYIRAFADPEAQRLDLSRCLGVGGHIHIAKVTALHGFEWVVPPKHPEVQNA